MSVYGISLYAWSVHMHMHSEKPKQNDILIGFIIFVGGNLHTVVQEVRKRELEKGR